MKYSHIKRNILSIKKEITNLLEKLNRPPDSCELLVVTKTRTDEEIKAVIDTGHLLLGENKVQELKKRMDTFSNFNTIKWHMIGHLQSNKFKYLAGKVDLIHSADSLGLLGFMNSFCKKKQVIQDVLLEFNLSGEESKYGFNKAMLSELINIIPSLNNIRVIGIMTMAPFSKNKDLITSVFSLLRNVSESMQSSNLPNFKGILSMGMSNDYIIAVKEGSSIIRIGTRIFEKD